ncbi:MAG TPA: FHA domain-containing protein [Polyangiaceae bacterium]|nr:FHA domain-containing protein [Polyangiaceae bacterium]
MALALVLLTPAIEPPLAVRVDGRLVVLGRGPNAHVRLPEPTVSLRHAALRRRGGAYLVSDEGSQNGTALGGATAEAPVFLRPGSPRVLEDGDRLVLGHVELSVHLREPPGEVQWVEQLEDLPARLVRAALEARGLAPSPSELARALRELESAADEPLGAAGSDALTPEPEPLFEHRPERARASALWTDGALLGSATVLLLLGLYALYWLVG